MGKTLSWLDGSKTYVVGYAVTALALVDMAWAAGPIQLEQPEVMLTMGLSILGLRRAIESK